MDCKTLRERISDYLDGQLQDAERREIAAHLDACQTCRAEIEAFQKTVDLVRSLPLVPAPEGFADRILQRALHVAPGSETFPAAAPARFSAWLPVVRGVAAAAVLFLFAYVGYQVVERENEWKTPSAETGTRSLSLPKTAMQADSPVKDAALVLEEKRALKVAPGENLRKDAKTSDKAGFAGSPAEGADGGDSPSRTLDDKWEEEKKKDKAEEANGDPLKDAERARGEDRAVDNPAREEMKALERKDKSAGKPAGGGDAPREPERAGSEDSIGGILKGESAEKDGPGPSLPVTLVVSTEDLSREREKVEALLESVQSAERGSMARRSLEPAPQADKKEGAAREGQEQKSAGESRGGVAGLPAPSPGLANGGKDSGDGGAPAPGGPGKSAEGRAKARAKGYEREHGAPEPEKENKVQDSLKPGAPAPSRARPAADPRRIEIRMSLGEYRRFKRELAETPSRFFEEPSNLLLAHLRAELTRRKELRAADAEAEAPDDDADAVDGARGAEDGQAGERLRRVKAEAARGPRVILVIRFEVEAAAAPSPTPTPPNAPAAAPSGAPEKKAPDKEKGE